jgi:hypothetical protein
MRDTNVNLAGLTIFENSPEFVRKKIHHGRNRSMPVKFCTYEEEKKSYINRDLSTIS